MSSFFKPTRATSPQAKPPDSLLYEPHLIQIANNEPFVPVRSTRSSVQKKWYEIDTGTPPSRNFKPPLLETSRISLQRWILLPPAELANPHPQQFSLGTPISSPHTTNHSSNQSEHNSEQTYAMPYNNTAIPPPEEITGTASLPC